MQKRVNLQLKWITITLLVVTLLSSSILYAGQKPNKSNNPIINIEINKGASQKKYKYTETKLKISANSYISPQTHGLGEKVTATVLISPNERSPMARALRGSVVLGKVIESIPARSHGRNGSIKIHYHTLLFPDGSRVDIDADYQTETFRGKNAFITLKDSSTMIAEGALHSAGKSLFYAPVAAYTTNGLSVGVSAALGGGVGAYKAMHRDGRTGSLITGYPKKAKLNSDIKLSRDVINRVNAYKAFQKSPLIGLNLKILGEKILKNEDYSRVMYLKVKIINHTDKYIYPSDMQLIARNGSQPLMPDIRMSRHALLNRIYPNQEKAIDLYYPIPDKAKFKDYKLIYKNPISHKHLAEIFL